jgi:hypothetical protein
MEAPYYTARDLSLLRTMGWVPHISVVFREMWDTRTLVFFYYKDGLPC